MIQLFFGLIGLIFLLKFLYIDWRIIVKITLFIVIFEGVLRKWVLPQASELIYFLKDITLLVAYVKYYSQPNSQLHKQKSFINTMIFICFGWGLFQVFSPLLGSPIIGFFGMKAYFFYIPLMWMLPDMFSSQEELYKFIRLYLLSVIPVAILAIVQYFSPINSPINIYAGGVEATASVGENVRVTGTFSYLAGFGTYLFFCFVTLIPLLFYPQKKIWNLLTMVELVLIVGTSFMTGSRGLLVSMIGFMVAYLGYFSSRGFGKTLKSLKKFILPTLFIIGLIPQFFSKAIDNFMYRVNNSDNLNDRIDNAFTIRWDFFNAYGIGASHQAVPALNRILNLNTGEPLPPLESEMMRVVIELGSIGFMLWYLLRLALIVSLYKLSHQLKNPFLVSLAISVCLYHLINFPSQVVVNHTNNIYYWFLAGFLYLLPKLEKQQIESLSSEKDEFTTIKRLNYHE